MLMSKWNTCPHSSGMSSTRNGTNCPSLSLSSVDSYRKFARTGSNLKTKSYLSSFSTNGCLTSYAKTHTPTDLSTTCSMQKDLKVYCVTLVSRLAPYSKEMNPPWKDREMMLNISYREIKPTNSLKTCWVTQMLVILTSSQPMTSSLTHYLWLLMTWTSSSTSMMSCVHSKRLGC